MVSIRITGFLLTLLLFSLQQWSSYARIGHAMDEKLVLDKDGVEVLIAGGSSSEVQKAPHGGIPPTAEVARDIDRGIEERKLELRKFLGRSSVKEATLSVQMSSKSASSSSTSSSSTGRDQNASELPRPSSLEYMEDQNEGGKGGTTRPIRASISRKKMAYSPASRSAHRDPTRSSKFPPSQEPYHEGSLQNLDAQKEVTESAREIMALTDRDYHQGPGRHPPPINNGHPLSRHHKP